MQNHMTHASSNNIRVLRGDVEDVAHIAECAKRLWSTKQMTLAEQIGRDSSSGPDLWELLEQLFGALIRLSKTSARV
jgi:hypothetical protein|tara:strand:- start:914 stop:1144 length:231 start_codon:yes stop_codon:yes gene_type:complete